MESIYIGWGAVIQHPVLALSGLDTVHDFTLLVLCVFDQGKFMEVTQSP